MNDMQTITTKLKTLLSQINEEEVTDKTLAQALEIHPTTFASMKHRNSIPYRKILDFCVTHHINANTLLFSRPINNTKRVTPKIKYYEIDASAGGGSSVFQENYQYMTTTEMITLFLHRLK